MWYKILQQFLYYAVLSSSYGYKIWSAKAVDIWRVGTSPSLPSSFLLFPFPLYSPFLHLPYPFPSLPLEVGPLNTAKGLGSAVSSPAGSGAEPQRKSNLVRFSLKFWYLVAPDLLYFAVNFTFAEIDILWNIKVVVCHKILVQWREFWPILVTDVFGFIDVLISFWGQKVKGQGHRMRAMTRKPGEYNITVNIAADFTKIRWCMHHWDILTRSKGQTSRSHQAITWKSYERHISQPKEGNFTQFWSQMYLGSSMCWLAFGTKGERSRSLQVIARKTRWIQYLRKYLS